MRNVPYIREIGCMLHQRMTQHRYTIRHKLDILVAEHFIGTHWVTILVTDSTPSDKLLRQVLEQFWITQLKE